MMYDQLGVIDLGDVRSVVMGILMFGSDPDGSDFPQQQEFDDDSGDN